MRGLEMPPIVASRLHDRLPAHEWRHRAQDRLHIAAGSKSEHRAAVVQQVEFGVEAATGELLPPFLLAPRLCHAPANDLRVDVQQRQTDRACEVAIPSEWAN